MGMGADNGIGSLCGGKTCQVMLRLRMPMGIFNAPVR